MGSRFAHRHVTIAIIVLALSFVAPATTGSFVQAQSHTLASGAHQVTQPEPTPQPMIPNEPLRGAENNPFEQIAAVGMLVVVAIAVLLHRASLRRRAGSRSRSVEKDA